MNENIFDKLDFGPLKSLLENDDITDISFDNNGQIWIRSLTQGSLRVEVNGATPEFIEKLAFQCSNVMGTTFNNAKPFLDAESSELRLNFVHQSIATNGIAMVIRKTPAKIRLEKEKLLKENYFTQDIHDFLIKCVEGHCNIIVSGETGSGKTEFVKYLASHTKTNEKLITIEDTLELHLDKIFPQRDIVAMKTNNVASYSDVLVTCMRQNPKWILLSEVRSAEAVMAVRNSISSGHNILSTIHADKASAIPYRMYSLMETDIDVNQFLTTIYRYVQLGVHIRAFYSKELGRFHREVDEVVEFYVDENNTPQSRTIYQKTFGKDATLRKPSKHLIEYLENQNIDITAITANMNDDYKFEEDVDLNKENEQDKNIINNEIIVEEGDTTDYSKDENSASPVPNAPVESAAPNAEPLPKVEDKNNGLSSKETQPVQNQNINQNNEATTNTILPIKIDDNNGLPVSAETSNMAPLIPEEEKLASLDTAQVEPTPAKQEGVNLPNQDTAISPQPLINPVVPLAQEEPAATPAPPNSAPIIPNIITENTQSPVNTELNNSQIPQPASPNAPLIPLIPNTNQQNPTSVNN